jgi:hypothetical protein
LLVPNSGDTVPGWAFDHVDQVFGIGVAASALYVDNGDLPGFLIRESSPTGARFTMTNSGTGYAQLHQSIASVANGYADIFLKPNGGPSNDPEWLWDSGAGVTGGLDIDTSLGGANSVINLNAGSAVTVAPELTLSASGSSTLLNVTNTGSGYTDQHQSLTAVSNGYADMFLKPNGGPSNAPVWLWSPGAGITGGIEINASTAGSSVPVSLVGGSAAGVTVNPFVQFAQAYSAAGTPIPTCTSSLAGALAQVTDGSSTYGATYTTGGGPTRTLVLCSGSAWITH